MADCSAFFLIAPRKEDLMSEHQMKAEAEMDEFNDELSDEALDREQSGGGRLCCPREIGLCG